MNLKNKVMNITMVTSYIQQQTKSPTARGSYTFHSHLTSTSSNHTKLTLSFVQARKEDNKRANYPIESHKLNVPFNCSKLVNTCELLTSDLNLDRLDSWINSIYRHKYEITIKREGKIAFVTG